jgi:hypothetical protein
MSAIKILNEAENLSGVSDRLGSLADQYPVVSETLLAIAANVRSAATILEVLVETKIPPRSAVQ